MITEHTDVRMEVKILEPEAKIPFRKRSTDAGYDLYSIEDKTLQPSVSTMIRTGIAISCPPGYYYTIEGRSSLWIQGIFPNRGIIDSTYTGEVLVSLVNASEEDFLINNGDRIAQIILSKQYNADFVHIDRFSYLYEQRGIEGFGSTGK